MDFLAIERPAKPGEEMEVSNKQLGLFSSSSTTRNFLEEQSDKLRGFKENFEKKEGFRNEKKGGGE